MQKYNNLEALRRSITNAEPETAGTYIKKYFAKKGLNALQASKQIGCSSSTLTRLFKGAALSVDMAASLEKHYGIDSKLLFSLEANSNAFKAKQKLVAYTKP